MKTQEQILEGLEALFEMDTYSIEAVKQKVADGDWKVDGKIEKGAKVKVTDTEDGGQTGTIMIKESDGSLNEKLSKEVTSLFEKWSKKNLKVLKSDFMQTVIEEFEDHLQDVHDMNVLAVSDITSLERIIKKTVFK